MLYVIDDAGKTEAIAQAHPSGSSSQLERFLDYGPLRGTVNDGT